MVKKFIKKLFVIIISFIPLLSFGAVPSYTVGPGGGGATFATVLSKIIDLLRPVPAMILTIALIYFFWGLAVYLKSIDQKKTDEARHMMINGIIALAVMVGVWGLVALITNTFSLGNTAPQLPQL